MLTSPIFSTEESQDVWWSLGTHRQQALERAWAGVFRDHVLPQLPVEALAAGFSRTRQGRPRKDFRLILGVLILQQLPDCTDAETVEAVTFHLPWHYALAVPPGAKIYLCERTVRHYRRVVITQGLDVQRLRNITAALVQACVASTSSNGLIQQ